LSLEICIVVVRRINSTWKQGEGKPCVLGPQDQGPTVCSGWKAAALYCPYRTVSWARKGKCSGHHRGLRAGHESKGATREPFDYAQDRLGRANCLLAEAAEDEGYCRRNKSPGVGKAASADQRAGNGTQTEGEQARYRGMSDK